MLPSDTMTAPIREPVLRGHQPVAGLWFPTSWFDPATRAARLIQCWRPGASAFRFPQGDLLCFATPVDEDCDDLPGWPLRLEGSALCSASLSDRERLVRRDGDVWIVIGAEALALDKRLAEPLDPSTWLAVEQLSLHDTFDCSVAPPPVEVLDLESRPLREVLGKAVPPASREQSEFLEALRRAHREHPGGLPTSGRDEPPGDTGAGPGVGASVLIMLAVVIGVVVIAALMISEPGLHFGWIFAVFVLIRMLMAGVRAAKQPVAVRRVAAPAPSRGIPPRSPLAHPQRWRRWLARVMSTTQLSRLLGRAHARHLRRVFEFFEDGNLAEALRHAIPLGSDRASLGQSFGMLGRRDNLGLSQALGPSTSINLGDDIERHLRALYRAAFEKLDREGRYEEAVFVLAELLNARREALDYLEKHERFEMAAELALGWDMPPDVIVRLHCLAGDWRRAVAVARRDKAFASSVAQLEKRWPDVARRLREEWGNALVQQGDWIGAVEAVWPVESLRAKATQWLLTAEAAGGRLAMRALVQRAVLLPDTLERYSKELLELQRDRERWRERVAMAEALMAIERSTAAQNLAAVIAPALLADHAQGHRRLDQNTLDRFVKASGDLLLQVDLPRHDWPAAQPSMAYARTDALCLHVPDAGALGILDAVPIDDQHYLLALGEPGACVVDVNGRIHARFATPTHRLVIADSRQVALLLARRENTWRVSSLDLAQQAVIDLGVLAFDFYSRQFDGLNWTIAQGRWLRVLDTQDSLRRVVWQVTDLPGSVQAFSSARTLEQIVLGNEAGRLELWTYRLPERQLTGRTDMATQENEVALLLPQGGVLGVRIEEADGIVGLKWLTPGRSGQFNVQTPERDRLRLWVNSNWLVVGTVEDSGYVIRWLFLANSFECVRVTWPEDSPPELREQDDEWVLFDTRGRVVSIDANSSRQQSFSVR